MVTWLFQQMLEEIGEHETHAAGVLAQHEQLRTASGRVTPTQTAQLVREIGQLKDQAQRHCDELHKAVQQQHTYEDQVDELTTLIQDAQKKLDGAPLAASSVEGLKQQITEHNVCAYLTMCDY